MKKKAIPAKSELLRLQKLYKTDEKIGERLGGVPAYLVAYWRRKKNIAKYSLPKFSETEVRTLWERYGDDEKAGLELGISKAAFYNWRRRYGLKEKPAFLKLEQLELNFPGIAVPSHTNSLYGKRSVVQKVLARLAERERVEVGEEVEVEPDLTVATIDADRVIDAFSGKADLIWNPGKVLLTLGVGPTDGAVAQAERNFRIREFARRQNIKAVFDLKEGGCPQIALEKGHILPGRLVVGLGPAASAYGAISCLARRITPEEMAEVWAARPYRITAPETARVVMTGRRSRGVGAVDVGLHLVDQLAAEAIDGYVLEYGGSVISQMSIGERYVLSLLSSATGAVASICTYDATTRRYLTGRAVSRYRPLIPDKDAAYTQLYQINIDQLVPQLAPIEDLSAVQPVEELQGRPVHHIVLGSCASGRFEDMRVAAEILKGHQVHEGCRFMIIPGSRTVYLEALKKGLIRVFIEAGALVVHPGTAMAAGDQWKMLSSQERGLTTTPLPMEDAPDGDGPEFYLCSPATAAASALNGSITDPTRYGR